MERKVRMISISEWRSIQVATRSVMEYLNCNPSMVAKIQKAMATQSVSMVALHIRIVLLEMDIRIVANDPDLLSELVVYFRDLFSNGYFSESETMDKRIVARQSADQRRWHRYQLTNPAAAKMFRNRPNGSYMHLGEEISSDVVKLPKDRN